MIRFVRQTLLAAGVSGVLFAGSTAWAASKTLSFDDAAVFGAPNLNCTNSPRPPMFNRPGYATQTSAFIVTPAACGEGAFVDGGGGNDVGSNGNDSYLQGGAGGFFSTAPAADEIRFSWVDPTNDNSWVRVITATASGVVPHVPNPTVDIRPGSKITMDIMVFGEDAGGFVNAAGQVEVSLIIRETGLNVPLGANGGNAAAQLEHVGVTGSGTGASPVGGTPLTTNLTGSPGQFTTISWTFVDADAIPGVEAVDIDINNSGSPTRKSVAGFAGTPDGILMAANNRGTLDSIAIRKAASDDTSKKWFVDVDNIVIDAPGVIDPLVIDAPVSVFHSSVTVTNIDPTATQLKLYTNGANPITADAPPEDFSDGAHTFTGLTLIGGDVLTATQVVGGNETPPSSSVTVDGKLCLEDFTAGLTWHRSPATAIASGAWYEVNNQVFATVVAANLDGSPALQETEGGFMNGFYSIYDGVVPQTRTDYQVTVKIRIEEGSDTNAIQQYQVGVVVNGVHRDVTSCGSAGCNTFRCHNESLLAVDTTLPGNAVGNFAGLNSGNNTGTQTVTTGTFAANAGDSLLIVFSTNVETRWNEVVLDANNRLDTVDPCETPSGFPPVPTPVPNEQGTWNVRPNRSNTSGNWGGGIIRVDDICLTAFIPCTLTPGVAIQTPLVGGQNSVTVIGVDTTATQVKVYDVLNLLTPIGTAPGNGTDTVTVPVSPNLTCNQNLIATQVVSGQEGCTDGLTPTKVCDCNHIGALSLTGPLNAGVTSVTVTGVSASATDVTIYDATPNPDEVIGHIPPPALSGTGTETVAVMALIKGHSIYATQTVSTLEGCKPAPSQVVGSGGNTAIRLSLGIREVVGLTGPVGSDGGAPASTPIEWIIPDDPGDPNDGVVTGAVPQGKLISPSPVWQTVTFDPSTAAIASFTLGDGVLNGPYGVLEHLAIAMNAAAPDVGPYTLYIDNITSESTNFADFQTPAINTESVFRAPSTSGTTSGHIQAPPNASAVVDTHGDASTKSNRVQWRWRDEAATRWIRLTTLGTASLPNPQVRLDQPITIRVLLLPALVCNTPMVDFDNDDDVDLADFGFFQKCFDPTQILTGCGCADVNTDGKVDLSDFGDPGNPLAPTFVGCASRDSVPSPCAP